MMLPPVMLPVALTSPAVVKFPPDTLAVATTCPAVVKLPPDTLPVALIRPVTYSPVVANTATLDVAPTPTATLPPELTIETFDVPLTICVGVPVATPVNNAPLPTK